MQNPKEWIHPEHQYEYAPDELAEELRTAGFVVKRAIGICAMPNSARSGRFDFREIVFGDLLSEDKLRESYCFYLESQKA